MSDTEQRIRERAFQLWEQAGCPHARSEEFWFAARQEIEGSEAANDDTLADPLDFPPESRSLEEPPQVAEASGLPGELPKGEVAQAQSDAHATAELPLNEAEAAAAEAPVPLRSPANTGSSDLRKAADSEPEAGRRPRPVARAAVPRPPQRPAR